MLTRSQSRRLAVLGHIPPLRGNFKKNPAPLTAEQKLLRDGWLLSSVAAKAEGVPTRRVYLRDTPVDVRREAARPHYAGLVIDYWSFGAMMLREHMFCHEGESESEIRGVTYFNTVNTQFVAHGDLQWPSAGTDGVHD